MSGVTTGGLWPCQSSNRTQAHFSHMSDGEVERGRGGREGGGEGGEAAMVEVGRIKAADGGRVPPPAVRLRCRQVSATGLLGEREPGARRRGDDAPTSRLTNISS